MRYLLILFFAVLSTAAHSQQINPVPDYIFRNQMSVGRNAVTDTAAYMSIGPRYGANKGLMPPIVVDTLAVTASPKRNGLLIFSVQKNKYLYWDSVRVQWSDMAGSSGNYIVAGDTSSMLSPYIRHAGFGLIKSGQALLVDSASIATRARVQKGIDSLGAVKQNVLTNPVTGTGTINYVSKWNGTTTQTNSQIFDGGGNIGISTGAPSAKLHIKGGNAANLYIDNNNEQYTQMIFTRNGIANNGADFLLDSTAKDFGIRTLAAYPFYISTSATAGSPQKRFNITSAGDVGISNTSPSYKLDITGTLRNTTGAAFATSSGNVLVGTTTDNGKKFQVNGNASILNDAIISDLTIGKGNSAIADNTALGYQALASNTTGIRNTATGYIALTANTTGIYNTANGYNSLKANTTGNYNTGFGYASLNFNTTGGGNTGVGYQTMHENTTGSENIGIGSNALYYNTTGGSNVGIGDRAFAFGSTPGAMTGSFNVGIGRLTLSSLKTGQQNTAIGDAAMFGFDNGSFNTAIGSNALVNNSTGSRNVAIGFQAGSYETGSNSFYVGNIDQSNTANDKAYSLLYGTFAGTAGTLTGQKLRINGTAEIATIDSTSTAMNILFADATGVIKKAAVPSGGGITGTGISGYMTRWSGASTQDTSQIFQLGRNIGFGTASPTYRIHLPDAGNTASQAMIAGTIFGSDGNGQTIVPAGNAMTIYGQGSAGYLYGAQNGADGRWGVNTRTLDAALNVNGNVKIVTVDSTSTAVNMLYQDVNGVIKKAAVPAGGGGGITTLAAIGSSPNANGATISGSTLNLQPASGSFGGVLTTGSQTIAGAKTFGGGINSTNYVSVIGSTTDAKYVDIDRYHVDSAGAHFIGDDNGTLGFGTNGLSINSSGTGSRLWLQSFGSGRSTIIGGTTVRTDRLVVHGDNSASDIIGAYSDDLDTAFKVIKNGEMQAHKAVAFKSASEAVLSANYTVTATDYFVWLPDLEGASRNVVLPTDATPGRMLVIFNTSSDGTYKWSFSGENVEDAAGAAVTTLTDQRAYTLIYFGGKFRITSVY